MGPGTGVRKCYDPMFITLMPQRVAWKPARMLHTAIHNLQSKTRFPRLLQPAELLQRYMAPDAVAVAGVAPGRLFLSADRPEKARATGVETAT
jgi:hypothetical protein